MYQVDNQQDQDQDAITEELHLYVTREELHQPFPLLPTALSVFTLIVLFILCVLSPYRQPLERRVIRLAAVYPPIQVYTSVAHVTATGTKIVQATTAHGILVLTNGSVVGQDMPAGMIFATSSGIEVITTSGVFVPAGSALGYGIATVGARAVTGGFQGNIPALSINAVYGTSLYIRNLSVFTGGKDAYSFKVETAQDKQTAISTARGILTAKAIHLDTYLVRPCGEAIQERHSIVSVVWSCQYMTFSVPGYMHVTGVKIVGKYVLVSVEYVARPSIIWFK
jgi:hypothetical protein